MNDSKGYGVVYNNTYEMHAYAWRKYLQSHEDMDAEARQGIESEIKIMDIMAGLTEDERQLIFDTGAYNDVLKAYCRAALEMAGVDTEKVGEVLENIKFLLDTKTAGEILEVK